MGRKQSKRPERCGPTPAETPRRHVWGLAWLTARGAGTGFDSVERLDPAQAGSRMSASRPMRPIPTAIAESLAAQQARVACNGRPRAVPRPRAASAAPERWRRRAASGTPLARSAPEGGKLRWKHRRALPATSGTGPRLDSRPLSLHQVGCVKATEPEEEVGPFQSGR